MNPNGTGDANGQAPGAPAPNGQAPTETPPATPQTPPNGQAPTSAPTGEDASAARIRVMEAELAEARREAAALRTEKKTREDADLSAQQRAEQAATEAKAALAQAREALLSRDIGDAARKAGITEPELAALEIRGKIKLDADGAPKNLDDVIKAFTEAHPNLVAPTPTSNQGRANAPRDNVTPAGRVYTQAELEDFKFYLEHEADIEQAMREGRVKVE